MYIMHVFCSGADGTEAFKSKLKFQIQHEVFRSELDHEGGVDWLKKYQQNIFIKILFPLQFHNHVRNSFPLSFLHRVKVREGRIGEITEILAWYHIYTILDWHRIYIINHHHPITNI